MSDANTQDTPDGIAIVGMSGRFPGAGDIARFWQNLRDGVESIDRFSARDLVEAGMDPAILRYPGFVNAGGVLEGVELFDAGFFGFNPREAEITDPQQRLFLECAWEALEHAGYDPAAYPGLIGVYAGVGMSKYLFSIYANRDLAGLVGGLQVLLGNDKDHLTTRVAYKLNLRGPAVTVQTACSTSLVAVCLACQSLLDYQCDMALAGGASISLPQRAGYFYQEGGIGSPDGHCRAFDASAQGTVGGNGVGLVLLKRLSDALRDGDSIHAVIKGWAVNNDGALKVGYTAPSVGGQAEAIAMAQAMAGVEPETITYVEAHGTGTPLGDPIEVAALTQVFRATTARTGFCAIGSVKTNIGHLDSAAGVAGLIKVVLALQHRLLPPSLHFTVPNPQIDFANSPFYVNTTLSEWKSGPTPRRAGVSSFGIGGTNAHVVLEETPDVEGSAAHRPWQLLVLSARTRDALETAAANLADSLRRHPEHGLADVAYTCAVGRRAFAERLVLACQDRAEATAALATRDSRWAALGTREPGERPVVFMFPGQGAQYVNMAAELHGVEPAFREQVARCAELLQSHLGFDLRDVLYPSPENLAHAAACLRQTAVAQPALFAVEYALAALWMEWGVRPVAMIGHSIGEYVAACLAGVFSLPEALGVVATRGRLMQGMPGGAMLATALPADELHGLLGDGLCLGAINAASMSVASGPTPAVAQLEARLTESGVECHRLPVSHAFHSAMMEPVLGPFVERIKAAAPRPPQVPFVSNLTGTWITAAEATDPDYWGRHLRHTVQFAEGLGRLVVEPGWILLEVGPGRTLSGLARRHPDRAARQVVLTSLAHSPDRSSDVAASLRTLGQLWLSGVEVDWAKFYRHERRRRVPLPTYPFQRQRYWVEPDRLAVPVGSQEPAPTKKPDVAEWFYVPSWRRTVPRAAPRGTARSPRAASRWLVFSDASPLVDGLTERLEREGHEVTTVAAAKAFARRGESAYAIDPRRRDDYVTLLDHLSGSGRSPGRVLHAWSVTPRDPAPPVGRDPDGSEATDFYSLLFLAQAIGDRFGSRARQIVVLTTQTQAVTGGETLCPAKATVLGPCRVIPQEYPGLECRCIDVAVDGADARHDERTIDQLVAELDLEGGDPVVALRGSDRWVPSLEAVRLAPPTEASPRLRQGGVYLITGGLGGIGLVVAEHLARTVSAKLVLVGRAPLPPRERWTEWVATHDPREESSRRIRSLQALEQLGADVLVLSADVADLEAMRDGIEQARQHFGALNGVIHAAGIAGGGMIQLRSVEAAARVLAPKLGGLMVLDALLQDARLDFFVLCSSLASILGGVGQVDYCAANAVLDAYAQAAPTEDGRLVVSINWDTWQEVGMAVNTAVPPDLERTRQENLRRGLTSREGVEVFDRVLGACFRQVAVSTSALQLRVHAATAQTPHAQAPPPAAPAAAHGRPALPTAYVEPRSATERTIARVWEELLGVQPIGVHDSFFELGGHSLLAIQLVSRLREALQVELPVRTLFDAPTVAELARRLVPGGREMEGDPEEVARVLDLVEQLSEDELKALLARQGDTR